MKYIKLIFLLIKDTLSNKDTIIRLAKKDFKTKYLGSYLGIIWAFVQPITTILIYWFVFQVGFKAVPIDNFPYILWLLSGIIPWFFFSDAISSSTGVLFEHSYLVKKVVFKVQILPIVKILSALFVHIFFICFSFILFVLYGYKFNFYSLQIFYYLIATIILLLGLSWIVSSLAVFLRDIVQLVPIVLQILFWLTPIFWSFDVLPAYIQKFFKLNPLFYIVNGYRDTFIYQRWFWYDMKSTLAFWCVTATIFIIGALLFRKLKPHFADVL